MLNGRSWLTFDSSNSNKQKKQAMKIVAREKARAQTLKVNQILRVIKINKKGGQIFSFEYYRWVVGQIQYRDLLWKLSE